MESYVSVNLKKDEILIKLSDKILYEKVVDSLTKKIPDLKKFYKKATLPIRVSGRVLKKEEIKEIESIIKKEIDVEIIFDVAEDLGLHSIKKAYEKDTEETETRFYKGSVRSRTKN